MIKFAKLCEKIDKLQNIKICSWSEVWGNKTRHVLFIPEPQVDFFCFILLSLAAKYEFEYIKVKINNKIFYRKKKKS